MRMIEILLKNIPNLKSVQWRHRHGIPSLHFFQLFQIERTITVVNTVQVI